MVGSMSGYCGIGREHKIAAVTHLLAWAAPHTTLQASPLSRHMTIAPIDVLRPRLQPSERLLWSGKPISGLRLRAQDAIIIPFSLVWFAIAVHVQSVATHWPPDHDLPAGFAMPPGLAMPSAAMPENPLFPIFGWFFLAIGVHLLVGRFIWDAITRACTTYGVTNQRVIIVGGCFVSTLKSLSIRNLPSVNLTRSRNGHGTIAFGEAFAVPGATDTETGISGARRIDPPMFDHILQVQQVYDLIMTVQRGDPVP